MHPFRLSTRFMLAGAALIGLAALTACGSTGATTAAPTPEVTEAATATTEPSATPTEAPTEPTTPAPTATATQVPGLITKDNAASLVELRNIDVSSTWISGLSFSPVDHQLATFGFSRNVEIWDADTGKRTALLGTQPDWGLGLAFSPDASRLVSGDTAVDVVLWDVTKGKRLAGVTVPPSRIYDVEWSPDGDRFGVVGQESSRLDVFSDSGTKIQELKTPKGWLWSLAWSKDFLAASNDTTGKTYIYDAKTYGNVGDVDAAHAAGELDFSPDGKLLVGCLRVDGTLHVWDTSNWSEITSWDAHPTKGTAQGCVSGDFSKDGSVYFSGGDDGNLIAWDVRTGDRLNTFEMGKMVWTISVSGDGKLVAAGLDDGQVKIIGLK